MGLIFLFCLDVLVYTMKIIVLQGINHNVGVSTIASALTYSMGALGKNTVCVDANAQAMGNSLEKLFGIDSTLTYGWSNAVDRGTTLINDFNSSPVFFRYEENSFFIPLGNESSVADSLSADSLVRALLEQLSRYSKINYVIIDVGIKGNILADLFCAEADIVLTVINPDGNSLQRIRAAEFMDREYFLLNKTDPDFSSYIDFCLKISNSKLKDKVLKNRITFEENVLFSNLKMMPITRFLNHSQTGMEIEKLIIYLMNYLNEDLNIPKDRILTE